MDIINTKAHGYFDYIMGLILIFSPWIFHFADNSMAQYVPVIFGTSKLLISMLTKYELGIVKRIKMKTHLSFDFLSGILLTASPWLLGFYKYVYLPHLVAGILEIGTILISSNKPFDHRRFSIYQTQSR